MAKGKKQSPGNQKSAVVQNNSTAPSSNPNRKSKPNNPQQKGPKRGPRQAQFHEGYSTQRGANPEAEAYVNSISFANDNIKACAKDIMLPAQTGAVRYADRYAASPTAVATPWQQLDTPWTTEVNEMTAFLFKDPIRSFLYLDPNPSNQTYEYQLLILDDAPGVGLDDAPPTTLARYVVEKTQRYNISSPRAQSVNGFSPHGPYLGAMSTNKQDWRAFWMEKDSTLNILLADCNAETTVTVFGDRHTKTEGLQSDFMHQSVIVGLGGPYTATVTAPEEGYYAFSVEADDDVNFAIGLSIEGNKSVYCHLPFQNLWTRVPSLGSLMVKAGALQYTNTAAEAYRAGQLIQYQVPAQYDWRQLKTYNSVAALNGVVPREVKNGAYSFLKPKTDDDFRPSSPITLGVNGAIMDAFGELRDFGDFLVIVLSIPNTSEAAPTAKSGYWRFYHSLEYSSSDVWSALDLPAVGPETWERALLVIRESRQHFENPKHVKDVVESILNGVLKYGPKVMKGATMLSSLL